MSGKGSSHPLEKLALEVDRKAITVPFQSTLQLALTAHMCVNTHTKKPYSNIWKDMVLCNKNRSLTSIAWPAAPIKRWIYSGVQITVPTHPHKTTALQEINFKTDVSLYRRRCKWIDSLSSIHHRDPYQRTSKPPPPSQNSQHSIEFY